MTLLSVEHLRKDFGGLRAVDVEAFALDEGEIRALIGPNGAGKTTFVSLLCGRIPPSSGRIHFDGKDITTLSAPERVRLGIAYTFQITSIFANLTVAENVALAAESARQGRGGPSLSKGVSSALEKVGLTDLADEPAGTQSYGHRRLVELAMGLALRPRLLILDEPTQGLPDAEIERFGAIIREIAADTTILLIEHNMDVVMRLASAITVLDRGAVLAEGTPEDIRANQAVQAAYLGTG